MIIKFSLILFALFVFSACSSQPSETNSKNTANISVSPSSSATVNANVANNSTNSANKTVTKGNDFDPFTGSVLDLMPKQVNEYVREKPDSDPMMNGTSSSVTDLYRVKESDSDSIALSISNYPSSEAAQTALKIVSDREKLPITSKLKNGKKVGIRITAGKGTNLMWTNGSMLCFAMGNGAVKAETVKSFEDKLAF